MKQTIFSKDEYWLGLIAEQKASGLSQAKFCSGRGEASNSLRVYATIRLERKLTEMNN